MKKNNLFSEAMNYTVAGYVYFVAFTLVLYMVGSLVTGILSLVSGLAEISQAPQDMLIAATRDQLGYELLHAIAFTIVLVKAYKILVAFAEVHYFNLKFLIEIAIIAPIIELLFNSRQYSLEMNILFASFAFVTLAAYLFFYKTIKRVSQDYEKERESLANRKIGRKLTRARERKRKREEKQKAKA